MSGDLQLNDSPSKKTIFDDIRQETASGDEYWSARDLMVQLEYANWQNFQILIHKAEAAVEKAGGHVENHFIAGSKMVSIGYGNERALKDYKLSRIASYLVAMNGDADQKPKVAEAQNYFAQKTRLQEINETNASDIERLQEREKYTTSDKQMSEAVMEAGISERGLAQIKSHGDKAFFGGNNTADMKEKYGLSKSKALADKMPTVLLSAKGLTNQMTKWKIEHNGLYGVDAIDEQHTAHNQSIRDTLIDEGMTPELLPPEEDTKVIKRRIENAEDIKKVLEG